jgi:hypothetical protein
MADWENAPVANTNPDSSEDWKQAPIVSPDDLQKMVKQNAVTEAGLNTNQQQLSLGLNPTATDFMGAARGARNSLITGVMGLVNKPVAQQLNTSEENRLINPNSIAAQIGGQVGNLASQAALNAAGPEVALPVNAMAAAGNVRLQADQLRKQGQNVPTWKQYADEAIQAGGAAALSLLPPSESNVAREAVQQAFQMGAYQAGSNVANKLTINPNQPVMENVVSSAIGGGLGGAAHALGNRPELQRISQPQEQEEKPGERQVLPQENLTTPVEPAKPISPNFPNQENALKQENGPEQNVGISPESQVSTPVENVQPQHPTLPANAASMDAGQLRKLLTDNNIPIDRRVIADKMEKQQMTPRQAMLQYAQERMNPGQTTGLPENISKPPGPKEQEAGSVEGGLGSGKGHIPEENPQFKLTRKLPPIPDNMENWSNRQMRTWMQENGYQPKEGVGKAPLIADAQKQFDKSGISLETRPPLHEDTLTKIGYPSEAERDEIIKKNGLTPAGPVPNELPESIRKNLPEPEEQRPIPVSPEAANVIQKAGLKLPKDTVVDKPVTDVKDSLPEHVEPERVLPSKVESLIHKLVTDESGGFDVKRFHDEILNAGHKTADYLGGIWKEAGNSVANFLGGDLGRTFQGKRVVANFREAASKTNLGAIRREAAYRPYIDKIGEMIKAGHQDQVYKLFDDTEAGRKLDDPSFNNFAKAWGLDGKSLKQKALSVGLPNSDEWNENRLGRKYLPVDAKGRKAYEAGYSSPKIGQGGRALAHMDFHDREHETKAESLAAAQKQGLDEANRNPLISAIQKRMDAWNRVNHLDIINKLTNDGVVRKLGPTDKIKPGEQYLNDEIFKGFPSNRPKYVANKFVADVLNRGTETLITDPKNPFISGHNAVNQAILKTQLSLNAYHYINLAMGASGSRVGAAAAQLAKGDIAAAAKSVYQALPGLGTVKILGEGREFQKALEDQDHPLHNIVKLAQRAGGIIETPESYKGDVSMPRALMQASQNLLFGKFGDPMRRGTMSLGLQDVVRQAGREGRTLDDPKTLEAARKSVQSVFDTFDTIRKDKNFQSNIAREALKFTLVFPQWKLSKLRLLGQSIRDVPELRRLNISSAQQKMLGITLATAAAGGAAHWASTGKPPDKLEDYFNPMVFGRRSTLPTPLAPILSLIYHHGNVADWAENSLAPTLNLAKQFYENEDWEGRHTRNNAGEVVRTIGKEVVPTAIQKMTGLSNPKKPETTEQKVGDVLGINKAPKPPRQKHGSE